MTTLLTLTAGDAHLILAPEIGGSVVSWTRGGEPIFRPPAPGALEEKSPRALASYPLVPYSNRVGGRRFIFAGTAHELPDLMDGFAIHGAGWQLPWRGVQQGSTARMQLDHAPGPLWPFAFHAEQTYSLSADALTCTFSIENRHDTPAPAGFGFHPYFPRSPEVLLQFTADAVWHGVIPTHSTAVPPEWDHRAGMKLGTASLDNCFAGWGGHARLLYPDRGFAVDIAADPIFQHLIVFVPPDRDFCAVEPVTNRNDGLNHPPGETGHGIFVLAPGEMRRGMVRFRLHGL